MYLVLKDGFWNSFWKICVVKGKIKSFNPKVKENLTIIKLRK